MTMGLTMGAEECLGRYLYARERAAALFMEAQCLGDHEKYLEALQATEIVTMFRMTLGSNLIPSNESVLQMVAFTAGWDVNLAEGGTGETCPAPQED